ncbi:MAG: acyl-CoA thioesterase [Prevotellaceae bacterium]|jgi:acyl-CoA thioester hydrolase|nr:acyl-CoA thioesterase [Prevotellaceae bacterium]
MLKIDTEIEVRYYETDQMGIVHHSNFIRYFEIARTLSMKKAGIPYDQMERRDIVMPIVSVSCNYKRPALFGDLLTVTTILEKLPTVKIEFKYEIHNALGVLLATGTTVLAFANKETLRPVRAPQYLLDILQPHFT